MACSPPVQRPTGVARDYEDAKDMFKRNRFDRAIEFADGLAKASPPNAYTLRALVLLAVIHSGQVNSYKELAEAYTSGVDATKNARFKAEYGRLRHDNLQYAAAAALALGEAANVLTMGGSVSKEIVLEAPYPNTEGPHEVAQLARVREGAWIEPPEQEQAAIDSMNKGIQDALAEVVGGDRAQARTALASGSLKLDRIDFALFLSRQLLNAASVFDRKHMRDSQKFRILCNEADEAAQAALALLKQAPNKEKEAAARKLQERIKKAVNNMLVA